MHSSRDFFICKNIIESHIKSFPGQYLASAISASEYSVNVTLNQRNIQLVKLIQLLQHSVSGASASAHPVSAVSASEYSINVTLNQRNIQLVKFIKLLQHLVFHMQRI